jgi:hypothetical protein
MVVITTSSTTTTTGGGCPAARVLGEGNPRLEYLRDFRDSQLAKTAVGRRIIQIYYGHADAINEALDRSPALRQTATRVLEAVSPILGRKED